MNQFSFKWFFLYLAAIVFEIIPLPAGVQNFRPPFILLFFMYLQFNASYSFSLSALFFAGIILDMLEPTLLGQHVFALLPIFWFLNSRSRRLIFYSSMQQTFFVFLACFAYELLLAFIDMFPGVHRSFMSLFPGALIGALLWFVFDNIPFPFRERFRFGLKY